MRPLRRLRRPGPSRGASGRRPLAAGGAGEVRLGYVVLPNDLDRIGPLLADWTADELLAADECARDVVRLLRANTFAFDPAPAAAYRDTPFAAVLGLGYLESAAGAEEEP